MSRYKITYPATWAETIIEADDLEEAEVMAWRAYGNFAQVEKLEEPE